MTAPYTIEERGSKSVFQVVPKPHIKSDMVPIAIASIVLGIFCATILTPRFPIAGLVLAIAVFVLLWKMASSASDRKRKVVPGTFSVSPDGVEVGGRTIPSDQIHRVVLRNGMDGEFVFVGGRSSLQQGSSLMAASGLKKLTKIAYFVAVEHGGMQTALAGGMDEAQAYAVFTEVSKRLGFENAHA